MEFKELTDGVKIPVLGLGTWTIGGKKRADRTHDEECIHAIRTAIELGITHIDTAKFYANGHAEELVGEAIQEFKREYLFITTKVDSITQPENLRYDNLISEAEKSLKRLRTSYVDLYLIHMPRSKIPIEETMSAMDYLAENKLTRFIGVSNFSVEQLREAQKHAENRIVADQIEYNLLVRNCGSDTKNVESEIIPYCRENGVLVIAHRPLAEGRLTRIGIRLLDELAEKYRKTQAQIALNWLISKPNLTTIPKSVNIVHIKENLGALGWRLDKEDMRRLDNNFPVLPVHYYNE